MTKMQISHADCGHIRQSRACVRESVCNALNQCYKDIFIPTTYKDGVKVKTWFCGCDYIWVKASTNNYIICPSGNYLMINQFVIFSITWIVNRGA